MGYLKVGETKMNQDKKREEKIVSVAKEIYGILSQKNCTVGEATEILRNVECVLSVAPTVQVNECSNAMFTFSEQ